jgi:hypothetical protein
MPDQHAEKHAPLSASQSLSIQPRPNRSYCVGCSRVERLLRAALNAVSWRGASLEAKESLRAGWLGSHVPGPFGNIDQRILGRSIAAEIACTIESLVKLYAGRHSHPSWLQYAARDDQRDHDEHNANEVHDLEDRCTLACHQRWKVFVGCQNSRANPEDKRSDPK